MATRRFVLFVVYDHLVKFEVAILKIIKNMVSSKHKLNFKSYRQEDPPFSLKLTYILLGTHNNEKQFICPLEYVLPLVNGKL